MDFTYDLTVDPDAENNTHAFALRMIGHNKTVLEVGCATGYFTKVLAERGCKVIGMEIDAEAAKLAEQWAERVVVGNADDPEPWDLVDDESFDVVTFGDVLEHLRDPLIALRRAVTKLKPAGFIVTSLPNVAHGDVRLSLLRGAFRYSDTGLLDRTHMRFFTLETVRELLAEAGMVVVDTQRVFVPLFHTEFALSREEYPEAIVEEIRADADSETYQFVMKSVVGNGSQAVSEMAHRLEESTDRSNELESQIRHLQEAHAGLNEELHAWTAHAAELNEQIRQLGEDLGEVTARAEASGAEADELRAALGDSEQRYRDLTNSRIFRLTGPLHRLVAAVRLRPRS